MDYISCTYVIMSVCARLGGGGGYEDGIFRLKTDQASHYRQINTLVDVNLQEILVPVY